MPKNNLFFGIISVSNVFVNKFLDFNRKYQFNSQLDIFFCAGNFIEKMLLTKSTNNLT